MKNNQIRNLKKLLVTGGSGFIGSAFIRSCIHKNITVLNVDSQTYAASTTALMSIQDAKLYNHVRCSINEGDKIYHILSTFQPNAIVNFAAETHVDNSISSSEPFIQTNVSGTHALLEAAAKYKEHYDNNIIFHHISTDEVYGDIEKGRFSELSQYKPNSPYSATKASSDMLVRAWGATYGLKYLISNCSNNYGPFQHHEKFIPKVINSCLRNKAIPIYGTGENIRDWLHVDDHVNAIHTLLGHSETMQQYVIGGDNELTNIQVAHEICDVFEELKPRNTAYRSLIDFVDDRPGHDTRYAIDCSKLKTQFEWEPLTPFNVGLRELIKLAISKDV